MDELIVVVRWQGTELRVRADELDRYPGAERARSAPTQAAELSSDDQSAAKRRDEPANKQRGGDDEPPTKRR